MGYIDKIGDPHQDYINLPWPTLEIISREEWGALPPTAVEEYDRYPLRDVIVGYTETDPCEDKESCMKLMQELQTKHMAEGETDIRFNYVVGLDQRVYEGRGAKVKPGVHPRYPKLKGISFDIVLSGQRGKLPKPGIKSAIMHIVIDKYMFNGMISFEDTKYTIDYDDNEEVWEEEMCERARIMCEKNKPQLDWFSNSYKERWPDSDDE